jgi:hypothetical protein
MSPEDVVTRGADRPDPQTQSTDRCATGFSGLLCRLPVYRREFLDGASTNRRQAVARSSRANEEGQKRRKARLSMRATIPKMVKAAAARDRSSVERPRFVPRGVTASRSSATGTLAVAYWVEGLASRRPLARAQQAPSARIWGEERGSGLRPTHCCFSVGAGVLGDARSAERLASGASSPCLSPLHRDASADRCYGTPGAGAEWVGWRSARPVNR